MFLHKLNKIFRANWTWISDCLVSSILKTVPVSQESYAYASPGCKFGEFAYNNTKPLFTIAWHFWTNTKYSGEVSLIISVDIHRKQSMPKLDSRFYFSLWRQYLQSLEIPKQILCYVLRGIKQAISRKLVKISDCQVSSFLKTVPCCRVSRHLVFRIWKLRFKRNAQICHWLIP